MKLHINWKTLTGPLTTIAAFILSPEFTSTLNPKTATIIGVIGGIVTVFAPSIVKPKE